MPQDVFGEHVGVRIVPAVPAPIHESVNEHNILRGVVSYHRTTSYRYGSSKAGRSSLPALLIDLNQRDREL